MEQYKCGYCEWTLKHEQLAQHSCFANNLDSLVIDNENTVFISEKDENTQDMCDKDKLDEDLITSVRNKPALYDFRLPVKQRSRKQKDDLWNAVSVDLKASYTPSEAEKRWNYLKDCYRKARNLFKKRQALQQKSGAAGTPKSETITPSFRHYNVMTFLNDTLEHRQTITSLRSDSQASVSRRASTLTINDFNSVQSVNVMKMILLSIIKEWKYSPQLNWNKYIQRKKLIKAILIYKHLKRKERKNNKRRIWVRSIFSEQKRYQQGDSNNLINEMAITVPDKYFEYLRMNVDSFTELLRLIESSITKQNVIRSPIPAHTRLEICLRYLATGDSMQSISFAFRIGLNTVSKIVSETCHAIWNNLKDKVFPENSENVWLQKANEFEKLWNFPNCIGAIDGKHILLQAPPHSGSTYYNYKNTHSIVLMALADANYCFSIVDIGAEGRRSDGGIFHDSELKHQLENNYLKLPKTRLFSENSLPLPYVIVGDEAFALTSYMLRPYSRSCNLDIKKKVFNYRLSRARRVVECAFGILVARWRIFQRPIATNINNAILIVQATVCLHNFLMKRDLNLPKECKSYSVQNVNCCQALCNFKRPVQENNTFRGSTVRDLFAQYFYTSGAITQQWTKAYTNDF